MKTRRYGARERVGAHPRSPRVPAAEDSSTTVIGGAPADDGPEAAAVPAEPAGAGKGRARGRGRGRPRKLPTIEPGQLRRVAAHGGESAEASAVERGDDAPADAEAGPSTASSSGQGRKPAGHEMETQTGGEPMDWSSFDIGRSIALLSSDNDDVVRRSIRRLHIRFWHGSAERMTALFKRAGAPVKALKMIKEVVDTCKICRMWTQPGNKSIATLRLAEHFNHLVQWDFLFHRDKVISHLIDEAIRWTVATCVEDREATTLIRNITDTWLRPYGPMKVLVCDRESAMVSEDVSQWLDRWNVQLKTKAPGEHAQIVERHHAILRDMILKVEKQVQAEGLNIPLDVIVLECAFAKNAMIKVAGYTPFQAKEGTTPAILSEFEPQSETVLDDMAGGVPGYSRGHLRLREVATSAMVELVAQQRIKRASESKTRIATQQLQLEPGDLVDFWRRPDTKDESGWRGPATLVDTRQPVTIRWQDRFLQVRTQDLRRALVYLVLLTQNTGNNYAVDPTEVLMDFAEKQEHSAVRVGWIYTEGWRRARANAMHSQLLMAVLHVAACGWDRQDCIGARIGRGISTLKPIPESSRSIIWWWTTGRRRLSWYCEVAGAGHVKLVQLFGAERWSNTAFVQFISAEEDHVRFIRQNEPRIPHVGGIPPPKRDVHPGKSASSLPDRVALPPSWQPPPLPAARTSPSPPPGLPPPPPQPTTTTTQQRAHSTPPSEMSSISDMGSSRPSTPRSPNMAVSSRSSSRSRSDRRADSMPRTPGTTSPAVSAASSPKAAPFKRRRAWTKTEPDGKRPEVGLPTEEHDPSARGSDEPAPHAPVLPLVDPSSAAAESEDDDDTIDYGSTSETIGYDTDDPLLEEEFRGSDEAAGFLSFDHYCANGTGPAFGLPGDDLGVDVSFSAVPDFCTEIPDFASYVAESPVDDWVPELVITQPMANWIVLPSSQPALKQGEMYVVRFFASGQREVMVEREGNILTLEEARNSREQVFAAMRDELVRWADLKAFGRAPRKTAYNVVDSRWVLKWKLVDKVWLIRARLTVRGFKDRQAAQLSTFAGTTSRWGQRLVNHVVVQMGWRLFAADVSQAFLRGMTFDEAAKLDGEVKRKVQFTVPPGSVPILQSIEGFETFDPFGEVLDMLRCGFGLKDAPRLWKKVLDRVLRRHGCAALKADGQVWTKMVDKKLVLIFSSHVDDMKGGGTDSERASFLEALKKEFGDLKVQLDAFECIGVWHHQDPVTKEIYTHQQHCVPQILKIDESRFAFAADETDATEAGQSAYMSIVGALAWLLVTIPAIGIFVAYLQRHGKKPAVHHLKKANRLLRWLRKNVKRLGLHFRKLQGKTMVTIVSDSAFKAQEDSGLVMRGFVILIREADAPIRTGTKLKTVLLDWCSRKHTRVVRSTYIAELLTLLDAISQGVLIATAMHETMQGACGALSMSQLLDSGGLSMDVESCLDARAVFDSVMASPVRTPNDKLLLIHALAVREYLDRGVLKRLTWLDTLDMLADGLTKGVVERESLIRLANEGVWQLQGLEPVHSDVAKSSQHRNGRHDEIGVTGSAVERGDIAPADA